MRYTGWHLERVSERVESLTGVDPREYAEEEEDGRLSINLGDVGFRLRVLEVRQNAEEAKE